MYTSQIASTITSIAKDEWDALIDDDVLASHGWLQTVEETLIGDLNSKYILLRDSDRLVGAAGCHTSNKTDPVQNLDDLLFGRLKKYTDLLRISFLPGLICCPSFCHGRHLFTEAEIEPSKKKIIMSELLNAIEDIAARHLLSPAFINVVDEERELIRLLTENGYHKAFQTPLNYIDITWRSFKEYLDYVKSTSKKSAKAIRNEMNRNKREGVTIEVLEHIDEHERRLYELLSTHHYRHNRSPFMFREGFLSRLKQALGDDVVFYAAFKRKVITGVCILLKRNKYAYLPMVGIDHELTRSDFTYFNLAYYRPISDAISNQTGRLYYGLGMYGLKAKRGCRVKNLYIYYKSFSKHKNIAARSWFEILSAWNKLKLPPRVRRNLQVAHRILRNDQPME